MGIIETVASPLHIRVLGENIDYQTVWQQMQVFTQQRDENTPDEIWLVQHPPVFTLGRNGKMEHVLAPGNIPVIPIDRGGQVTYHGPGQLVGYLLLDIRRKALGVRELVMGIEQSIITLLARYGIQGQGDRDAPGVYVDSNKIAALGLRVTRGCTYHGLSLNVDMDLEPFQHINPCGYAGLQVTQCKDLGITQTPFELAGELCECLAARLGYAVVEWC
ncbi:MAG: lipoyl(octanoyl) transferase LipB [Gammaproteobacteria bacterium]|nr:lipoyl(octanoyl) transferase LipB [Gammaproteobacteria bacterium]MBU1725879.1 lipoyl(octanoyl) transferase LipB [Gammaproteobacteria bacterium]MBU2006003.1 lipoyl(octanoyl) transferase LipB [Gammaproteobacteria bacterium]